MTLTLDLLRESVEKDAAIRSVRRLQPAGGPGDKIFPPSYPGARDDDPAPHVFETRRIDGMDVRCVLIDSVQSQANRLEEALLRLIRAGRISLPYLFVDFTGQKTKLAIDEKMGVKFGQGKEYDLSDLGEITSLEAPHRVFDAIFRDAELDGKPFSESPLADRLRTAKPQNAGALFDASPTALLFGAWNSTGGGGLGAKFTRCVVSEVIGVGAALGKKTSSRIDPLGIRAEARVLGGPSDWVVAKNLKGEKNLKPSRINHSNIKPEVVPGGVTIDYALHTAVITCAGLRRLTFRGVKDEVAGRAVLAALGLVALTELDHQGYSLRSRCDLVGDGDPPFELVRADGSTEPVGLDRDNAIDLLKSTIIAAKAAGLEWSREPVRLVPQQRLTQLVALSRAKGLKDEAETAED